MVQTCDEFLHSHLTNGVIVQAYSVSSDVFACSMAANVEAPSTPMGLSSNNNNFKEEFVLRAVASSRAPSGPIPGLVSLVLCSLVAWLQRLWLHLRQWGYSPTTAA